MLQVQFLVRHRGLFKLTNTHESFTLLGVLLELWLQNVEVLGLNMMDIVPAEI
jgi:hypothetical protein